jgi:radical SAM superfamily enzyme YgiQ (UPF0313 family)
MQVLLVNPRPPRAGTSFTRIRTLTLPSVAAALMPRARVTVVDEAVQEVPQGPFDLVGISSDTPHAPRAYALADQLRDQGRRVLLGGTHPTAMPDEALQHADAVVVGEIEGLGARLLDDLEAGTLRGVYELPERPDLDALGVPPVDLLPTYSQRFQPYPVELTRGCRNACRFCFNKRIHGPGFRRRPLGPVIEAVRARSERMVLCMDDNIMNDKEHLAAFAEAMLPLGRIWGGQSTLDIADDPELLQLLRASGFSWTFLGLESFSPASLASEAKAFNRTGRYVEQLAALREHGIMPFLGVMLGLDHDGPEVFERTGEALQALAPAACAFTMPVAYPGTPWHAEVLEQGRLLTRDLALYDGHHAVVKPLRMSTAELLVGYHRLARSFYGWRPALRRLAHNLQPRRNVHRAWVAASFLAVTKGYRRYHRRIADA